MVCIAVGSSYSHEYSSFALVSKTMENNYESEECNCHME